MMGYCYMYGRGVNRDRKEAFRYFNEAVTEIKALLLPNEAVTEIKALLPFSDLEVLGDAYCDLGNCYRNGYGVAADSKLAIHYWKLSADQNCAAGQNNLAACYVEGVGVQTDLKMAKELFRPLIEKGDAQAQCRLGEFYIKGMFGENKEEEGVKLLQLAAKQENPDAQALLGECYFIGRGINLDKEEALRLWTLAVKRQNAVVLYKLGLCYLNGYNVPENKEKGFHYLKLAAQSDHPKSDVFVDLGRCYQHGYGVKEDLNQALRWFRLAGENENALCGIAQVMLVSGRFQEAFNNFKAAAERGQPYAQDMMGGYCEAANPPNLVEAESWYAKSATQGNQDAKKSLQKVRKALLANRLRNTGSPLASRQSSLKDSKANTRNSLFDPGC